MADVSHHRLKILLIEPNAADARWLDIALGEAAVPHDILKFSSEAQAFSTLQGDQDVTLDLIVIEYRLPFLTPTEAIARLRSFPQLATVPIAVAVTDEAEIREVHGTPHFLMKPIDPEQLLLVLGPADAGARSRV